LPEEGAWQQTPPQESVVQAACWHVPPEQAWPAGQVVVQNPQCAGSVFRSTQLVPQRLNPAAHVGWQVPVAQVWPAAQALPQEPQFLGSLERSVQTAAAPVPQTCLGATHVQVDEEHTSPTMQTAPQSPQLDPLEALSTQVPVVASSGQSPTVVGVVLHAHAAAVQVPRPQERPQVPQFAESFCLSTQTRLQMAGLFTGQVQLPLEQVAPTAHELLHEPQ
jgi:hypothetical protein